MKVKAKSTKNKAKKAKATKKKAKKKLLSTTRGVKKKAPPRKNKVALAGKERHIPMEAVVASIKRQFIKKIIDFRFKKFFVS